MVASSYDAAVAVAKLDHRKVGIQNTACLLQNRNVKVKDGACKSKVFSRLTVPDNEKYVSHLQITSLMSAYQTVVLT